MGLGEEDIETAILHVSLLTVIPSCVMRDSIILAMIGPR